MDSPPPGYYPDPSNPARLRYWNGSSWEDHTPPPPSTSPIKLTPPSPAPLTKTPNPWTMSSGLESALAKYPGPPQNKEDGTYLVREIASYATHYETIPGSLPPLGQLISEYLSVARLSKEGVAHAQDILHLLLAATPINLISMNALDTLITSQDTDFTHYRARIALVILRGSYELYALRTRNPQLHVINIFPLFEPVVSASTMHVAAASSLLTPSGIATTAAMGTPDATLLAGAWVSGEHIGARLVAAGGRKGGEGSIESEVPALPGARGYLVTDGILFFANRSGANPQVAFALPFSLIDNLRKVHRGQLLTRTRMTFVDKSSIDFFGPMPKDIDKINQLVIHARETPSGAKNQY